MEEQEHKHKHKAGLHKEISTIFEGVPIPRSDATPQPSSGSAPQGSGQVPGKPQPPPGPSAPTTEPKPPKVMTNVKSTSRKQSIWQRIKSKLFGTTQGVSSTRQKLMVVLVPILLVVLIYKLVPLLRKPSAEMAETEKATPVKKVAGNAAGKIDWEVPEPYPTTLRDPTKSPLITPAGRETNKAATTGRGPSTVEKLVVKGIVYSQDKPSAVIGTRIVHEGDKVLGATVVKINVDSVEFEMDGKRWTQKVER